MPIQESIKEVFSPYRPDFSDKKGVMTDFGKIRSAVEKRAVEGGYTFKYQITPMGL